jgi:hypothetical protein
LFARSHIVTAAGVVAGGILAVTAFQVLSSGGGESGFVQPVSQQVATVVVQAPQPSAEPTEPTEPAEPAAGPTEPRALPSARPAAQDPATPSPSRTPRSAIPPTGKPGPSASTPTQTSRPEPTRPDDDEDD